MKWFLAIPLVAFLLSSCETDDPSRKEIILEIKQGWEFREISKDKWLPATVPGTVHTDLLNNGLIADPFYRLNELDLQWIDKTGWEYQCVFDVGAEISSLSNKELELEGLDTYADVFLNDSLILNADNMFRTWTTDVAGILREGKNELRILFRSPTLEGLARMEAYGLELPADNDQSERGGMGPKKVSPFARKAPYHFGWDWGPRLVTSGIWRPVKLVAWDKYRIHDVHYILRQLDPSLAEYTAIIQIKADRKARVPVRLYINEVLATSDLVDVEKGKNQAKLLFNIEHPRLWWPNGAGEQALYSVRLELGPGNNPADLEEDRIGVRKVELIRQPDEEAGGMSFYFEVNGRSIFAKGANYIPNDIFLPRVSPADYEFIIKSAADANMNMLRVWGGGIYENELFYDLCDQYGIMVWQDFMFACAMYPGNPEFLESVRQEAIDNVTRLRNHPCLALWCGNNEIELAWAEWEEDRGWGWKQRYDSLQRKTIWAAYDTVFHHILPEVVTTLTPLPYWHSSPSAGFEKLSGYGSNSGDMHYWGVWHGLNPLNDFRKYRARFMSEYGFQSFPEFHSVKKYTVPDDWNIESEVMASHQRSGIGNLRIRQYMEEDYILPQDFEEFLYAGQLLQAEAIKLAIESHRSEMPYCMGSLYWQINDCWPVASWSGIDYYKRWKALHYFVREAFKPVMIVTIEENDRLTIKVISDRFDTIQGETKIRLLDFAGREYLSEVFPVEIAPNGSSAVLEKDVQSILGNTDPASAVLVIDLYNGGKVIDRCLYYFVKAKEMKLTDPGLETNITENEKEYIVSLSAKHLAKNVFISVDGYDGQFSDNYIDIVPGETLTLTCPNSYNPDKFREQLKLFSLFDTTH